MPCTGAMSGLTPKADMCGAKAHVCFGSLMHVATHVHYLPEADIKPRRLGARYRQNRHDLHGIARKDRKVRMLLEQLGGSVMRFRANDRVGTHRVAYVFDAALAHLFRFAERPAHPNDCSAMLFDPRFPGRDPLLRLCVSRLLGKGIPGCHARAGFAPEE